MTRAWHALAGAAATWLGWRLRALALALACLAVAGCGPDEAASSVAVYPSPGSGDIASSGPVAPTPGVGDSPIAVLPPPSSGDIASSSTVHATSDPTWYVAPTLEEQIFTSSTIVRATMQSATAAVETLPGDSGGSPTYRAVHELRFTVHEYLKGDGPTTIVVAVRDSDVYASATGARTAAEASLAQRNTTWDAREGVLFLSALNDAYTPTGGAGTGPALGFTRSNPGQSPWAYSVNTLSRAWLPVQQADGAAGAVTHVTPGAQPPPELRVPKSEIIVGERTNILAYNVPVGETAYIRLKGPIRSGLCPGSPGPPAPAPRASSPSSGPGYYNSMWVDGCEPGGEAEIRLESQDGSKVFATTTLRVATGESDPGPPAATPTATLTEPPTEPPVPGPAPGSAKAYIMDWTRTPPQAVTLADLRTQIATLAAGENVPGYAQCVRGRIGHQRYRRAEAAQSGGAWVPPQQGVSVASGAAAGTEIYKTEFNYNDPQYNRYWLSGPDAARFQTAVVDADTDPQNGYALTTAPARPLPAGVYRVHSNLQHYKDFPCNFKPDDAYIVLVVTVTAPVGTLHEAFFDPVAIGTGIGAGGDSGALTPTSFSVRETSTTMQRLVWDDNQIQLDLSAPVALRFHALEVIGLHGAAALQLNFNNATSAPLPGGGQAWRWRACAADAPWTAGDQLMLRLSPAASASTAASDALGCGPAPTFGASSYALTAAENAAVGVTVITMTASGQGKDAVSYALTAGNTGGAFAINASTGAITVAKALDYETTASYTLTVEAVQPTSAVATATVTITVTDVAETPRRG